MFTRLFLAVRAFPAWLARAKRDNPWLYSECLLTMILPAGVLVNFFSFRDDTIYLVFLAVVPAFWILFQPFLAHHLAAGGVPFGARAMSALPILAMTIADLVGMPAIVYARDRFGAASYDEFYLLAAATVVRIGLILVVRIRRYRGKPLVDALAGICSLVFSIGLYALSITS